MRRTIRPLLVAALVLLACSACTARPASPARPPSRPAAASTAPASVPPTGGPATTVVVMGDSLSRGFDACAHYGDCPSASWAAGTDPRVDSVADRLGVATGGRVVVRNVARSGATSADLDRQATLALAARPDLVTLLIGANDVCRASLAEMTPTEVYTRRVTSALQRIALLSPTTTVLVASVPDVPALLPAAASDRTARFLWANAGTCPTVLADPLSSTPEAHRRLAEVGARIDAEDAALERACAALARCVWDGGALHAHRPSLATLSAIDAFHPSIAGLREVAAIEWKALSSSPRARPLLER